MLRTTPLIAVAIAVLMAVPATAIQETRTLDVDVEGTATSRDGGEDQVVSIDIEGDVVVSESGQGVDRTAHTNGPSVTITVTLDGTDHEIPVTIAGEGVSLVQTGVSADAWNLFYQGSTFGEGAQVRGNLTLIGTDEGYSVTGRGVLTLQDGADSTNYALNYAGEGTFA